MASDGGAYNSYVPVNSHNLFSFESKSRRLVCPIDNRDNNKKHRCCISIVGTASCLAFYGRLSLAPVTKMTRQKKSWVESGSGSLPSE